MKYNESQRGKSAPSRNDRKADVKEHHRKSLVECREWARERCKLYKLGGTEKERKRNIVGIISGCTKVS